MLRGSVEAVVVGVAPEGVVVVAEETTLCGGGGAIGADGVGTGWTTELSGLEVEF